MGSGSLLLILAAVGVDYGWQPDGTRSKEGDNLEYIIQIPPDQIGRLQRVGEITSVLDPSISARVSKIVVRVGNGTIPRNAGDLISAQEESALTPKESRTIVFNEGDEQVDIVTPELMATPRTVTDSDWIAAQAASTTTSRMKPAQQYTNGIDLPSSLPSTVTASSEVSTEPITSNRTNQWTDIRNQKAPRNLIVPPPPLTATPSDAPVALPTVASQTQIEAEQSKAVSWPPSQSQPDPKGYSENFRTEIPKVLSLPEPAVSTNPDNPKWSGYGREPNSLSRLSDEDESQEHGDRQTPRTANESNAISTAPIGNEAGDTGQLQREQIKGAPYLPRVQSVSNTSPPSVAREYWVDQYGRKLDKHGNLVADNQPKNPLVGLDRNGPSIRTPTEYQRPEFGIAPSSVSDSGLQSNQIYTHEHSPYHSKAISASSVGQIENKAIFTQQSTTGTYDSNERSLSLQHDKPQSYTKTSSTESDNKNSRRMNAQPFFNFILLISLVGNAYLIYETGNLRRKFRSMISAIRTSKITPQGA